MENDFFILMQTALIMKDDLFVIETKTPFSKSLIWQLNRDFYQKRGLSAWSDDIVPHHMTSNSKVGKTYAELIFALLKDLAAKGKLEETVYLLELGAGHGRLAFHILKHLKKLVESIAIEIPKYCYVLSDIVEENLSFFQNHPQFQKYLKEEVLDVAFFDAIKSNEMVLRNSQQTIHPKDLNQPIVAIANYFFDSLPNDLFFIKDKVVSACSVSINSKLDPKGKNAAVMLKDMDFSYHKTVSNLSIYEDQVLNEMLTDYSETVSNTYLFFPQKGIECINNIKALSNVGLVLLTMDKGFHEIANLQNKKEPDIITHGSFSLWVNYHALGAYCQKKGGKAMFPEFSNFHLDIGCLLFLNESDGCIKLEAAYEQFVNNFGPDDFNSVKQLVYNNISRLRLKDLIALLRLSAYDSTFFIKMLPRIKQTTQNITVNERKRLGQTMKQVWDMYFYINEDYDLAYEIGGLFFDLGFYEEALDYFQYSINLFGKKPDIYYNQALCYYQLRQDQQFIKIKKEAQMAFPKFELLKNLEKLVIE